MALGSIVRISYGATSLLMPSTMTTRRYAPDTHDLAEPRLTLRAFGGHQAVAGLMTLAAARTGRHATQMATLCLLIDSLDVASALLEIPARGEADRTVIAGILLSGCGVVNFTVARGMLRRWDFSGA